MKIAHVTRSIKFSTTHSFFFVFQKLLKNKKLGEGTVSFLTVKLKIDPKFWKKKVYLCQSISRNAYCYGFYDEKMSHFSSMFFIIKHLGILTLKYPLKHVLLKGLFSSTYRPKILQNVNFGTLMKKKKNWWSNFLCGFIFNLRSANFFHEIFRNVYFLCLVI